MTNYLEKIVISPLKMLIGVLKAIGSTATGPGRITKDVVAFHAADFTQLVQLLQLDLHEPPITQCVNWFVVILFFQQDSANL